MGLVTLCPPPASLLNLCSLPLPFSVWKLWQVSARLLSSPGPGPYLNITCWGRPSWSSPLWLWGPFPLGPLLSIGCLLHPQLASQLNRETLILLPQVCYHLCHGFFTDTHFQVKNVAFYFLFTERFYKNLTLSFMKSLFLLLFRCSLHSHFCNVINHIDWFWMLNSFCISRNNLTLLYFIYRWIRFADPCGLEFSLFCVHKIYSSLSLQYLSLLKVMAS